MLSVDANVLVRFVTRDDPAQSPRARDLLRDQDTWAGVTVVLETEWVLRSAYRYTPGDFAAAVAILGGLSRLQIEEAEHVQKALAWHVEGMDFADALHAALSDHCEAFVTFDKPCLEAAGRLGFAAREP
jgi:predicted nucleic-acid-binding protein